MQEARYSRRLLRRAAVLGVAPGTRPPAAQIHHQGAGDLSRSKKSSTAIAASTRRSSDIPSPNFATPGNRIATTYAAQHKLDLAKQWITLMPGSRVKEVRMNLPAILEAAAQTGRGL